MQIFKRLFVDKITKDFDPSKDITLGPWCFNNEKSLEEINLTWQRVDGKLLLLCEECNEKSNKTKRGSDYTVRKSSE